jgi:cytochrome c oxidase assembly protein subunit 11
MTMGTQQKHGRTVLRLSLIVVGMFGFGWALIPLYDLLCEITGLGGRTGDQYVYDPAVVQEDGSRLVQVNFITNTNGGMPWEFWAEKGGVRVHPGEVKEVKFYVRNNTNRRMIGQAIPSVVPIKAAAHFHKTECFCFNHQVLEPGETMEMPMRFIVGSELPKNVPTISLSYALFDVTELAADELTTSPTEG